MAEHVIKLPDVGEGIAEAELVEWHVKVGDLIREDTVLAAVMTDKATVEIPSPVEGRVSWLNGEIGETIAVGSPIVKIEVIGGAETSVVAPAGTTSDTQIASEGTAQGEEVATPAARPKTAPTRKDPPAVEK